MKMLSDLKLEEAKYNDRENKSSSVTEMSLQHTNTTSPFRAMKDSEYSSCVEGLGLLEGEEIKLQYVCLRETLRQGSTFTGTANKGLLVFTNDNMIFMQQQGLFSSHYSQALRIPLESISGMEIVGTLIKHIRINIGTSGLSEEQHFNPFKDNQGLEQIETVKREIEALLKQAREEENRAKAKENVQIIVDFSSQRETITQSESGLEAT